MKTDDLRWGSYLTPLPRHECGAAKKSSKKVGEGGVLGGHQKTKSAQKYYLGIVKKFQINRISRFLAVGFQKNVGQI